MPTLLVRMMPTWFVQGALSLAVGLLLPSVATGQILTVNGVPLPDPVTTPVNSTITVEVNRTGGAAKDWVALASVGAANTSYLSWKYLNGTQTQPSAPIPTATLSFALPTTPGGYEIRFFSNGGYTRIATSGVITSQWPAATVRVGGQLPPDPLVLPVNTTVLVDVSNGPALRWDWVAMARVGAPLAEYLTWKYLNDTQTAPATGVSSATVWFQLPSVADVYEFRFFASPTSSTSSSVLIGTSTSVLAGYPVTVNDAVRPTPITAPPGGALAVGIQGGPANPRDWVGLYTVGSGSGAYLAWQYLNGTQTPPAAGIAAATLGFAAPTQSGAYEFRFFANDGYQQLGASTTVTVLAAAPALTVNGTAAPTTVTFAPSTNATVSVTNGPGYPTDWVALAEQSAPAGTYVAWQYLNGTHTAPTTGLTAATLTFPMPATSGNYEFRLFAQNGFSRVATSGTVVVAEPAPAVTISLTEPTPGATVTVPASVTLTAATTVSGGSLTQVQFFADGVSIGSDTAAPYALIWASPSVGAHTLTAVATDNTGTPTTSAPVGITVVDGEAALATPTTSPSSGTYGAAQTVTLSGPSGATIRYTTDGTTPTSSSPAYTSPLNVTQSMTIRALATQTGAPASAVAAFAYVIDTTAPIITASYSPEPNTAGWHQTPVTVSFTCTDGLSTVTSCPSPVLFDQEGANQTVTVSATDAVGNVRSTTITVQIDLTPPEVTGTAPTDGTTITVSSITVAATVADILSGVATVTCNGVLATVTGNTVDCVVPAAPGQNSVTVAVQDAAGNSSSWGARVLRDGTPTQLTVAPANRTLTVGEAFAFTVASEFAPIGENVVWTSSDPTILSVASDGSGVVTGETPGTVTLTATVGGLSAPATVTVQGLALAPGAIRWAGAPPTPGAAAAWTLPAQRIDDSGPDLFAVEQVVENGPFVVQGLAADGRYLWTETMAWRPAFGDQYGGLLAVGDSEVARLATGATHRPWRYRMGTNPTGPRSGLPHLAQGLDGTVYLIEPRDTTPTSASPGAPYHTEAALLGLEGDTGAVRFRTALPRSSWTVRPSGCDDPSALGAGPDWTGVAHTSPLTVGDDGAAFVLVETWHDRWDPVCVDIPGTGGFDSLPSNQWQPGLGTISRARSLHLLRITAAGALTSTTIWQWQATAPDTLEHLGAGESAEYAGAGSVLPDTLGGVLATWTHWDGVATTTHLSRVVGATTEDHLLPADHTTGAVTLVADGVAYLQSVVGVTSAIGLSPWTTRWTGTGTPVLALASGNVLTLATGGLVLSEVSPTGSVVATTPLAVPIEDALPVFKGQGSLHGTIASTRTRVEVATLVYNETRVTASSGTRLFQSPGIAASCQAPPLRQYDSSRPPNENYKNLAPGRAYTYRFVGTEWTPDKQGAVSSAFLNWTNELTHIGVAFNLAAVTQTQDITVRIVPLPRRTLPDGQSVGVPAVTNVDTGSVRPDGTILGGVITFNSDENVIKHSFLQAALHEIGHLLGLDDSRGTNRSSVMNQYSRHDGSWPVSSRERDDPRGNVARVVRPCDASQARLAPERPWP